MLLKACNWLRAGGLEGEHLACLETIRHLADTTWRQRPQPHETHQVEQVHHQSSHNKNNTSHPQHQHLAAETSMRFPTKMNIPKNLLSHKSNPAPNYNFDFAIGSVSERVSEVGQWVSEWVSEGVVHVARLVLCDSWSAHVALLSSCYPLFAL